jgi:hypothetical protein
MPPTEKNIVIGSKPVSPGKTKESAALEYWTPERRAAAKPFPLPQRPKGGGALIEAPQNVGKPGFHAHGRPRWRRRTGKDRLPGLKAPDVSLQLLR